MIRGVVVFNDNDITLMTCAFPMLSLPFWYDIGMMTSLCCFPFELHVLVEGQVLLYTCQYLQVGGRNPPPKCTASLQVGGRVPLPIRMYSVCLYATYMYR